MQLAVREHTFFFVDLSNQTMGDTIMKLFKHFKPTCSQLIAAAFILSSSGLSYAAPSIIPNTFSAGTPANAADVNANFTAVESAIITNTSAIANVAKSVLNCSVEINSLAFLTSTTSNIDSVTITTSGPGQVLVTASGMLRVSSYNGSPFHVSVYVVNTSLSYDSNASNYWGPAQGGMTGVTLYDQPFSEQNSFTLASSGSNTFYLTGRLLTAPTAGYIYAGKSRICALFIPD